MIQTLSSLAKAGGQSIDFRSGVGEPNLENPRTPLSKVFDTVPSYTGKTVTADSAMQLTAVSGCIRIIAHAIAKTPVSPYRLVDGGPARNIDKSHYLYELLRRESNPLMSAFRFKRLMQTWVLQFGNAYAEMIINGRGQITALNPWNPRNVRVTMVGDDLLYELNLGTGNVTKRWSDAIFHLRGLETDGIMGLSPIAVARQSIGLGLAAEEYGARFFGNNGRPGMVLKHPGQLGDQARKNLVDGWNSIHKGLQGAHSVGVLEEGMELQEVGIPPEDAFYLGVRNFSVLDICRIYGMAPHLLAQMDAATFGNIEQQGIEVVRNTYSDWFANWEAEIEHKMLSPREKVTIEVGFDASDLLQGDLASTALALASLRQNGFIHSDEGRGKWLKLNPIGKANGGEKYSIQSNMMELDKLGEEPPAQAQPKQPAPPKQDQPDATRDLREFVAARDGRTQ